MIRFKFVLYVIIHDDTLVGGQCYGLLCKTYKIVASHILVRLRVDPLVKWLQRRMLTMSGLCSNREIRIFIFYVSYCVATGMTNNVKYR